MNPDENSIEKRYIKLAGILFLCAAFISANSSFRRPKVNPSTPTEQMSAAELDDGRAQKNDERRGHDAASHENDEGE